MKTTPTPKTPSSFSKPRVATALRRHLESAGLEDWQLPAGQQPEPEITGTARQEYPAGETEVRRVLGLAVRCRHGELGSHLWSCKRCSGQRVSLNSCRNRHCPSCGGAARRQWKLKVTDWELACPYWHVVFTLPHELNPLMVRSGKTMYRLLLRCVRWTLLKVAKRGNGCQPGMIMTLHTWGQRMNPHVHVHVMLTGGGMSTDSIPTHDTRSESANHGRTQKERTQKRRTFERRIQRERTNREGTTKESSNQNGNSQQANNDSSPCLSKWVPLARPAAVLDAYHLADVFKKTYLRRLKGLMKTDQLDWPVRQPKIELPFHSLPATSQNDAVATNQSATPPTAYRRRRRLPLRELNEGEEKLLAAIKAKPWIVDCQPAPPQYVGSDALVNYLASYISGTAISDRRMLAMDDQSVEFSIKDYRNKLKCRERLSGAEFVQRYALHVLPARMQRVRYAGLFRAEGLEKRLEECRTALGEYQKSKGADQTKQSKPPSTPDPWREDEEEPADPGESAGMKCECGQMMESALRIDPAPTMSMISFVQQTVSNTLPLLLSEVLRLLLAELRLPSASRRMCRQLQLYGREIDALRVMLSEEMGEEPAGTEDGDLQPQTHERYSGIPPPANRFIHDDGMVTKHA